MGRLRQWGFALSVAALCASGCAAPSPPAPAAPPPTAAQAGGQTIVAIQPAGPPPMTLPQFLGINDLFAGLGGLHQFKMQVIAMFFPQLQSAMALLEPPPPILPITDPANLKDDAPPVVQAAAEAQAEQDTEAQKVKAIEALGRIGCVRGMPAVEEGLAAALDDQNRFVRRSAVKAISGLAGSPCVVCKGGACCTPKIYKRLHRMAYKETTPGCFEETDATNRRLARLALQNCQPRPPEPAQQQPGIEGPNKGTEPPLPKPEGPSNPPPPAPGITAKSKSQIGQPRLQPPTPAIAQSTNNKVVSAKGTANNGNVKTADATTTKLASDPLKEDGVLWESVTAPFDKFASKTQSWAAMVYFRKRAKRIQASPPPGFVRSKLNVQTRRWTKWADLDSLKLKQSLVSLPIGRISPVIAGEEGYLIVRVLKRKVPAKTRAIQPIPDNGMSEKTTDEQIRQATQTILKNSKPKVVPTEATKAKVAPTPPGNDDHLKTVPKAFPSSNAKSTKPIPPKAPERDTRIVPAPMPQSLPKRRPTVEPMPMPKRVEPKADPKPAAPIPNSDQPWNLDNVQRRPRKRGNVTIVGGSQKRRSQVRPADYHRNERPLPKTGSPQKVPGVFVPPKTKIKPLRKPIEDWSSTKKTHRPKIKTARKTTTQKERTTNKGKASWLDSEFGSWSKKKSKR